MGKHQGSTREALGLAGKRKEGEKKGLDPAPRTSPSCLDQGGLTKGVYLARHLTPSHRAAGMGMIQLQVGFPPPLLDELEAQADKAGMNRAAYLRSLVEAQR